MHSYLFDGGIASRNVTSSFRNWTQSLIHDIKIRSRGVFSRKQTDSRRFTFRVTASRTRIVRLFWVSDARYWMDIFFYLLYIADACGRYCFPRIEIIPRMTQMSQNTSSMHTRRWTKVSMGPGSVRDKRKKELCVSHSSNQHRANAGLNVEKLNLPFYAHTEFHYSESILVVFYGSSRAKYQGILNKLPRRNWLTSSYILLGESFSTSAGTPSWQMCGLILYYRHNAF